MIEGARIRRLWTSEIVLVTASHLPDVVRLAVDKHTATTVARLYFNFSLIEFVTEEDFYAGSKLSYGRQIDKFAPIRCTVKSFFLIVFVSELA